jgi:hypothetical membrane protein
LKAKQVATNIAVVLSSLFGALLFGVFAAGAFVFHVEEGFNEGTPLTLLAFTFVFVLAFVIFLFAGNWLVKRQQLK